MSHGVTCAPPTTTQLITHPGRHGGKMVHPKCERVLTRHPVPVPPPRLYVESNDLSLRQRGGRSITRDICDIALIEICISAVSSYQSNHLTDGTRISQCAFSGSCVPTRYSCWFDSDSRTSYAASLRSLVRWRRLFHPCS